MLHVAEPIIAPKQSEYVNDCLNKNWLSWKGEYVERFEEEFAKKVGAKHAVMVSSGTAALEIAYQIAILRGYYNLIVPNFSFIATLSAGIRAGFVNIRLKDIDYPDLAITKENGYDEDIPAVKVIVPISGLIDWEGRVSNKYKEFKYFYIVDAAQAIGTKIPYNEIGMATYSFFANKFISTGEGGMIATNEPLYALMAKELRSLPSFEYLDETKYPTFGPQTNSRPTNIQAAIGLAQLEVLDEKLAAHKKVYNWYREALNSSDVIKLQKSCDDTQTPWMTRIRINTTESHANNILSSIGIDFLDDIEWKPFYTPFSKHPLTHQYLPVKTITESNLIKSHSLKGFYIPTHQNVKESDIEYITTIINNYA